MVEMFAKEANPVEEARAGDIIALVSLPTPRPATRCAIPPPGGARAHALPGPCDQRVGEIQGQGRPGEIRQPRWARWCAPIPRLHLETDRETGQTILRGMGELHLEVTLDRMRTEFGVEGTMGEPQVAYRETITKKITSSTCTRSRPAAPASSPRSGSTFEPLERSIRFRVRR